MNKTNLVVQLRGESTKYEFELPDECPICHAHISPLHLYSCRDDVLYSDNSLYKISSVFGCQNCHSLFYANYAIINGPTKHCELISYGPEVPEIHHFSDEIQKVSTSFIEIYNQAESAETYKLGQIAGVGYRKALEFLIKDYAIHINPTAKDEILNTQLSPCIQKYIDLDAIKNLATLATWLGNDETHYLKTWNEMDLQDLKRFIVACVAMIQANIVAKESADLIASRKK